MGMEVLAANATRDGYNGVFHEKETKIDAKEHGDSVLVDQSSSADFVNLKNASEEWPVQKQVHTFYFVRYHPYDDPKMKAKLEQADKDIQKKSEARSQVIAALGKKREERKEIINKLKPLSAENKQYNEAMNENRKKMEPLHNALGIIRSEANAVREKGAGLCSSEEELNALINRLEYRISHESISLDEEKRLLREIKQLESTRSRVIASAAMRTQMQETESRKEALQGQFKIISADIEEVKKERQIVRGKIKELEDVLKIVDDEIAALQNDLASATIRKDKAYDDLNELRKSREMTNAAFYQNRALRNRARDLATRNDVGALRELSHQEIDKFMSDWNMSKGFREDYEKRILVSLNNRAFSRDGRMRNPDEKLIVLETQAVAEAETAAEKSPQKQNKESTGGAGEASNAPSIEVRKGPAKAVENVKAKANSVEDTTNLSEPEKPPKELKKQKGIDPEQVKAMKREEEIAKNKLALERKKKLAEKAAAKATIIAQKEAEKKQKKKKKAKKNAAGATPSESDVQSEVDAKIEETVEERPVEETPAPRKTNEPKEVVRKRTPLKKQNQLHKVALKKKKSPAYWSWAAPAAGAVSMLLVAVAIFIYYGYYLPSN